MYSQAMAIGVRMCGRCSQLQSGEPPTEHHRDDICIPL